MRFANPILWMVLVYLLTSPAWSAPVLQPTKPWVVHFDDAECYAERAYGPPNKAIILGFRPSPSGDTYELLVARKQRSGRYAEQLQGSVDFGQQPVRAWVLRYGIKGSDFIVDKYRIQRGTIMPAKSSPIVILRNDRIPEERFALESLPGVLSTLDRCNEDLRQFWNMTGAEVSAVAQPVSGDIRRIFTAEDYPDDAQQRDQEGTAKFLVFVDEKGAVAACYVVQPSGSAALDGMGCQVIQKRAKFKPAIGKQGKPIRSAIETPPVTWRLEGF